MITIGIVLVVIGIIAWACNRIMPQTHPVSTFVMYICLGLGFVLLAVGIVVYAIQGTAIEVDSQGKVTVR